MQEVISIEKRLNLLDERLNSIMRMMSGMMNDEEKYDEMEEKINESNSLLSALANRPEKKTGASYMPYAA